MLSISGVIGELGKAPFVDSWIVLSKSGTVNNYLFCGILSDTLVDKWATCVEIYRRNASLRHLPMIIIVSGNIPATYITISARKQRE